MTGVQTCALPISAKGAHAHTHTHFSLPFLFPITSSSLFSHSSLLSPFPLIFFSIPPPLQPISLAQPPIDPSPLPSSDPPLPPLVADLSHPVLFSFQILFFPSTLLQPNSPAQMPTHLSSSTRHQPKPQAPNRPIFNPSRPFISLWSFVQFWVRD